MTSERDPLSVLVENTFVEGMDHGLSFAAIADEIVSVVRSELMSDQADSVLLFGRMGQHD